MSGRGAGHQAGGALGLSMEVRAQAGRGQARLTAAWPALPTMTSAPSSVPKPISLHTENRHRLGKGSDGHTDVMRPERCPVSRPVGPTRPPAGWGVRSRLCPAPGMCLREPARGGPSQPRPAARTPAVGLDQPQAPTLLHTAAPHPDKGQHSTVCRALQHGQFLSPSHRWGN